MLLHKLRRTMVNPEREPLKRAVELDEFFLGGYQEGLSGGRARGKKTLCGVAVEVRGRGSGRVRLKVLADASPGSLGSFVKTTTEAGAIVNTDGWGGYNGLAGLGYDHRPRNQSAAPVGEAPYLPARRSRDLEPEGIAARTHHWASPEHSAAYLDVSLPPQPPRQPARRLPDAARAEHPAPAQHLPGDHRPGRMRHDGTKPVCTAQLSSR